MRFLTSRLRSRVPKAVKKYSVKLILYMFKHVSCITYPAPCKGKSPDGDYCYGVSRRLRGSIGRLFIDVIFVAFSLHDLARSGAYVPQSPPADDMIRRFYC